MFSQSGLGQPNHIKGLIMWLDASEAGTLSRSGTDAKKMYDKAPGGYSLTVDKYSSKPRILQSRFNGKTILRFEKAPQFLIGQGRRTTDNITSIGIVNGKLCVECTSCVTMNDTGISVPAKGYVGPVELAELLVYDSQHINQIQIDWISEYLITKWQI